MRFLILPGDSKTKFVNGQLSLWDQVNAEEELSMKQSDQPIHFAGTTLVGKHRHICALFYTDEQEYRVLLPFIQEGFERGERAFHIVDSKLRDQHLGRLQATGIDTLAEEQNGQLEGRRWHDTYLRNGYFDLFGTVTLIRIV